MFQAVHWNAQDIEISDDDGEMSRYLIKIFGVTEKGNSVAVNVVNYTPFFFLKVHHEIG